MTTSARIYGHFRADVVIGPYKCTFKRTDKPEFEKIVNYPLLIAC